MDAARDCVLMPCLHFLYCTPCVQRSVAGPAGRPYVLPALLASRQCLACLLAAAKPHLQLSNQPDTLTHEAHSRVSPWIRTASCARCVVGSWFSVPLRNKYWRCCMLDPSFYPDNIGFTEAKVSPPEQAKVSDVPTPSQRNHAGDVAPMPHRVIVFCFTAMSVHFARRRIPRTLPCLSAPFGLKALMFPNKLAA